MRKSRKRNRATLLPIVIVLGTVAFLTSLVATLVLNSRIADRAPRDAQYLDLAGRQGMLVQRVTQDLLHLQLTARSGGGNDADRTDLGTSADALTASLGVLLDGGQTALGAMPAPDYPGVRTTLLKATRLWDPLADQIRALARDDNQIDAVAAQALATEPQLIGLLEQVEQQARAGSQAAVDNLARSRSTTIGAAIASFYLIIVALAISVVRTRTLADSNEQLARSAQELEREKAGTDVILRTVRQGLLLVDRDLRIADQYSPALETILNASNLGGRSLLDVLHPHLANKEFENAQRYFALLFDARRKERAVAQVNALEEVEFTHPDAEGKKVTKWLSFSFKRVVEGDEIVRVFVAVEDITERAEFQRELRASEERKDRQLRLLAEILAVDSRSLDDFVASAREQLAHSGDLLNASDFIADATRAPNAVQQRLSGVARSVHSVKGNAALTGLASIAAQAETFETELAAARERKILGGEDYVVLAGAHARLQSDVDDIVELRDRFRFAHATREDDLDAVSDFACKLAAELHKDVRVVAHGVDLSVLGGDERRKVKDVLSQLVRNSLGHGIESPEERELAGKPRYGTITIEPAGDLAPGAFGFVFRDDGRGLDPTALRARGLALGLLSREAALHMDDAEAIGLIFKPGFSTTDGLGSVAGRGVGMDVIRERVIVESGGEIRILSTPGRSCQFTLVFPHALRGAVPASVPAQSVA